MQLCRLYKAVEKQQLCLSVGAETKPSVLLKFYNGNKRDVHLKHLHVAVVSTYRDLYITSDMWYFSLNA